MQTESTQSYSDQQVEINRVLQRLQQKGVASSSKPTMMVNTIMVMKGRNGGYPKDLYHQHLDPIVAINEDQENYAIAQGYGPTYIDKRYPKMLLRRNMHPKFAAKADPSLGAPDDTSTFKGNEYVEERIVANEKAEKILLAGKVPTGCSQWVEKLTDLPDPDAPDEDQSLLIARLEGQLAEAQRKQADAPQESAAAAPGRRHGSKPTASAGDEAAKDAA
jgi:hypothetical protein